MFSRASGKPLIRLTSRIAPRSTTFHAWNVVKIFGSIRPLMVMNKPGVFDLHAVLHRVFRDQSARKGFANRAIQERQQPARLNLQVLLIFRVRHMARRCRQRRYCNDQTGQGAHAIVEVRVAPLDQALDPTGAVGLALTLPDSLVHSSRTISAARLAAASLVWNIDASCLAAVTTALGRVGHFLPRPLERRAPAFSNASRLCLGTRKEVPM